MSATTTYFLFLAGALLSVIGVQGLFIARWMSHVQQWQEKQDHEIRNIYQWIALHRKRHES